MTDMSETNLDKAPIIASIDIGSNSSLLLAARTFREDNMVRLQPVIQKATTCRLGQDLHEHNVIQPERIKELKQLLTRYRQTVHNIEGKIKRVVLTEAVRKAENQEEIVQVVRDALWVEPEILSGAEEAKLGWTAVASLYQQEDQGLVSLDIGGGSTELSNGEDFISMPMGALKLTKMFGSIPNQELSAYLTAEISPEDLKPFAGQNLILTSGTATALGMLHQNLGGFDEDKIEGYEITAEAVNEVIQHLSDLSQDIRNQLPGLEGGRGEIILCGLHLMKFIINTLKPSSTRISTRGLRFGALFECV